VALAGDSLREAFTLFLFLCDDFLLFFPVSKFRCVRDQFRSPLFSLIFPRRIGFPFPRTSASNLFCAFSVIGAEFGWSLVQEGEFFFEVSLLGPGRGLLG